MINTQMLALLIARHPKKNIRIITVTFAGTACVIVHEVDDIAWVSCVQYRSSSYTFNWDHEVHKE